MNSVQEALERGCIPLLLSAILLGVGYVSRYFWENYTSPQCLQSFFTNAYLWVTVLAVLGCGKKWLNRSTQFSTHLAPTSFGLYIVHYPIALTACWLLSRCPLPNVFRYLFALAAVLALTPAVYALLWRIPVVRYLVLGCRKQRPN